MPLTVQDILDIIEGIAPAGLAENWDNIGLMVGNPSASVASVLVGLDPTTSLLEEARACGADLLITHHPSIFLPLQSVHLGSPEGIFLEQAIRNRVNVVGCHTNLDSAAQGISASLAEKLGLEGVVPLLAHAGSEGCGLGRIGSYRQVLSPDAFIEKLRAACSPPWILATPNRPAEIRCVAVCGGSCSELATAALKQGAQVFVTSEVKHSTARWAEQAGLWLIDAGHFATENQAMASFAGYLSAAAVRLEERIKIYTTQRQQSPLLLV